MIVLGHKEKPFRSTATTKLLEERSGDECPCVPVQDTIASLFCIQRVHGRTERNMLCNSNLYSCLVRSCDIKATMSPYTDLK